MNPCPCGFLGHYSGKCHCTPDQVARYRRKISGPLLDRIDLHVEVPAVPPDEMAARSGGDSSEAIRARVIAARERQLARQGKPNAQLSTREIDKHARPDSAGEQVLKQAISRLGLSARGYHRVLKVARTIADLAGRAEVCTAAHVRRRCSIGGWQLTFSAAVPAPGQAGDAASPVASCTITRPSSMNELKNWQEEQRSAYLYTLLAQIEGDTPQGGCSGSLRARRASQSRIWADARATSRGAAADGLPSGHAHADRRCAHPPVRAAVDAHGARRDEGARAVALPAGWTRASAPRPRGRTGAHGIAGWRAAATCARPCSA